MWAGRCRDKGRSDGLCGVTGCFGINSLHTRRNPSLVKLTRHREGPATEPAPRSRQKRSSSSSCRAGSSCRPLAASPGVAPAAASTHALQIGSPGWKPRVESGGGKNGGSRPHHSADIYRHQRRVCNDPRAGRSRRCRSPRHPPGPGGRPAPPRRPSPLAGLPTPTGAPERFLRAFWRRLRAETRLGWEEVGAAQKRRS